MQQTNPKRKMTFFFEFFFGGGGRGCLKKTSIRHSIENMVVLFDVEQDEGNFKKRQRSLQHKKRIRLRNIIYYLKLFDMLSVSK